VVTTYFLKKREKRGKNDDSKGKFWITIDFSTSVCQRQPSGRNDIEHDKTRYAEHTTNNGCRLTEIFPEYDGHFLGAVVELNE